MTGSSLMTVTRILLYVATTPSSTLVKDEQSSSCDVLFIRMAIYKKT